jgi:hypothetical protein
LVNENSAGRVTLTIASGIRATSGRTAASASRSAVAGSVGGASAPSSFFSGSAAFASSAVSPGAPSPAGAVDTWRVFWAVRATRRRVVCSPRSPDSVLSRSLPIVVISPRSRGTIFNSSCSTGVTVSAVVSSGVPTGRLSSTVNSP